MNHIGAPLVGSYDGRLVLLSIFIAISASYVALDLGGRVTSARGWVRSAWLGGGATALGLGIWSMHFTGMLAFSLPVPVAYHWPTVLLSLLAAIFAAAIALHVVSRRKMGRVQAFTGSVLMGLGIVLMHYIGMAAMRLSAECHYNLLLVAISLLIAIIASLVALVLTFDYREDFRGTTFAKVMSAGVMGAAIFLMHYTGMMSASFIPSTVPPDLSHAISISSLGLGGIAVGILLVQGVAILTSAVDRRFAIQAQELQTSDRFRQIADNLQIVLALANADFTELLYVNHTYQVIWGRTLQSVYAEPKSWLEGIHPEDRGHIEESLQRLIGGQPIDNLECRVVRPDGSTSWVACRGLPIRDAEGHVYRLVASAQDITQRKRAEEALTTSEREQRQIAAQFERERARLVEAQEVAKIGSWEAGLPSLNLIWSEQTHRIFETDPSRFHPTRPMFREFIHPEDRAKVDAAFVASLDKRSPCTVEYRIVMPDGRIKFIEERWRAFHDEEGKPVRVAGTCLDITERVRADQELRQAEERIRAILEYSPNWIFLKDTEGRYLLVNREIERVFGISQEQIKGKTDSEIFPPERAAENRANDLKVLRAGLTMEFEEIALLEDGPHTSIVHKFPLFDTHGNIYATGGVATDITERKRGEEARRYSEEQYRTVVETATDAVISIDEASQILLVNPAATKIFGYDLSELIGRPLTMLMPESLREPHKTGVRRYLTTKQRHMNWQGMEQIGLRKTGEEFPVEISFGEITKQGQRIFTGFIRDITERKRAEEALRRSEERYRLIVENQTEFIVKWLPDGTRTFANENYCRTFGIAEADCLGTSFYPLVDPEFREEIKRKVAALTPGKPEFTEEHPSFLPDGQHWQQWMTRGIFDAGGNLIELLSAGRDITQLKRAEEELRQLSGSLLRSQDKERRRIARDLHDSTGQDLVALATMLGQLRSSLPSAERKSRRLLSECSALADHCIREVRTLSYVLHPPVLDQAGLGDAIRDYVGGFTERSGIHVELDLSPSVGRMPRDVELALFRVVQESLTNIQRHSGSQRARIRVYRNSDLTLEISDLGRGVSAGGQGGKEEPRFEVGVGIPSMRERVKLIGGRLDIDSTSHGTTVRVTIPLERNEREKAAHSGG